MNREYSPVLVPDTRSLIDGNRDFHVSCPQKIPVGYAKHPRAKGTNISDRYKLPQPTSLFVLHDRVPVDC